MAGDDDDAIFDGLVDYTDAPNDELENTDVPPAVDIDDQVGFEKKDEEDQGDGEDQDNEDDGGAGEEGTDGSDDEDDGDGDADEDVTSDEAGDPDGDDDTGEAGGDGEEEGDDAPKKKRKKKISPQDRINQINRKMRDEERGRLAAEAEVVELKKQLTGGADGGTDGDDEGSSELAKPDVTDTDKYPYGELDPQYQKDLTSYEVELKFQERDAKRAAEDKETADAQDAQEWADKYDAKIELGSEAYEDFDEVVVQGSKNNTFPLTPETTMMALKSPVGHHVVYEIATNPELAERMARSSLVDQALEFGRISARFENKSPKKKNNKVPNTTDPAPRRKGGAGVKQFDAETASFAEFEEHERARGGEKRH